MYTTGCVAKDDEKMKLTIEEKEYLLGLLEWQLSDHEGLREWKNYDICKKLMTKIEES